MNKITEKLANAFVDINLSKKLHKRIIEQKFINLELFSYAIELCLLFALLSLAMTFSWAWWGVALCVGLIVLNWKFFDAVGTSLLLILYPDNSVHAREDENGDLDAEGTMLNILNNLTSKLTELDGISRK